MRQIRLEQPGHFHARDVAEPVRAAGEALVRVHRIGVCGTDLNAFAGRQPFFEYPRVIGHELGVEIVEIDSNDFGLNVGDRCAVEPYSACGRCRMCRSGRRNCCPDSTCLGVHVDGGMQQLVSVRIDRLHQSEELTFAHLALVETLGIGAHAVERAAPNPGDELLIVGAGPIGLAVLEFANQLDCAITIVDKEPKRLEFAERFGVRVGQAVPSNEFDVILDATGNRESMEASIGSLAFGGTIVFVGIVTQRLSFDDPFFHRRELTIKATRNSAGVFPKIIQQLESGRIDLEPWMTHTLDFDLVPKEFGSLRQDPNLVKAVINVEQ